MPVVKIIRLTRFAPRKAQSVERQPFKLVAVGSSPTSGVFFCPKKEQEKRKEKEEKGRKGRKPLCKEEKKEGRRTGRDAS